QPFARTCSPGRRPRWWSRASWRCWGSPFQPRRLALTSRRAQGFLKIPAASMVMAEEHPGHGLSRLGPRGAAASAFEDPDHGQGAGAVISPAATLEFVYQPAQGRLGRRPEARELKPIRDGLPAAHGSSLTARLRLRSL